ncbi:MAG: BrnA antitoxin family protein [Desulfovibrionaceae bacterium]|nr:BrnA antitoxin family protein [Desulfovibrionaceae bacterium]
MNNNAEEMKSLTDWKEFDVLTDEQVIAAAKSDPDAQPVTENEFKNFRRFPQVPGGSFLDRIRALGKENKVSLTVRYDADIADFFKKQGKGYQRLMNNILRAYMETQQEQIRRGSQHA